MGPTLNHARSSYPKLPSVIAYLAMLIKLSIPGQDGHLSLSQFTGNRTNQFGGCEFRVNEAVDRADAWFIFEDVDVSDDHCIVPREQVHFLSAEASWRPDKYLDSASDFFFQQFSGVHSCHPVRSETADFAPPFLPWMINANHESIFRDHTRDIRYFEALEELPKDRPLSVFCSSQGLTPQHRLRFAFVEHLKNELGDDVEWFGNGVNPVDEKWQGLARFERTLVLENRSDYGVYTEKILDSFLGLSVPIYWGAPDIQKYFPVPRTQQINISDFKGATHQIRKILSSPVSKSDLQNLMDGKTRVLSNLHFLHRIIKIAEKHRPKNPSPTLVSLSSRGEFRQPATELRTPLQKTVKALYRKLPRPRTPLH